METIKVSKDIRQVIDSYGLVCDCVEGKVMVISDNNRDYEVGDIIVNKKGYIATAEHLNYPQWADWKPFLSVVIVSETEEIGFNEGYLLNNHIMFEKDNPIVLENLNKLDIAHKVIVSHEQFSEEQLQDIMDCKMRHEDKVLIEVEGERDKLLLSKSIEELSIVNDKGDPDCKTCNGHGCLDDGSEFGCVMIYCPDCYPHSIKRPLTFHKAEETWDDVFERAGDECSPREIKEFLEAFYHTPKRIKND